MKLSARFALFHCGRCGRDYASPLGHLCVVRMDRKTPVGKTRLAPSAGVSATCKCGKPLGNPLTHVCVGGSDFKRRKAAAAKAAKAARPKHLYQACHDEECSRIPCEAFREGRAEGYQNGHADGSAAGFDAGFAAGAASVSTTNGG
jgi:hypothetical protein